MDRPKDGQVQEGKTGADSLHSVFRQTDEGERRTREKYGRTERDRERERQRARETERERETERDRERERQTEITHLNCSDGALCTDLLLFCGEVRLDQMR